MSNIREISRRTGVSVHTLRYWEDKGVLPPVPRNYAGERDYDELSVKWIAIAKTLKDCGFRLEDIRRFVELAQQGDTTIAERRELLAEARRKLEKRIAEAAAGLEQLVATDRVIAAGADFACEEDEDYLEWLDSYGLSGEPDKAYAARSKDEAGS